MMNPFDAEAATSGGRSGGSSFRAPSSSRVPSSPRSSSSSRGSTRLYSSPSFGGPIITPIMPMPMYSPFGYGYGGGFGFNPFGFVPINLNVLIIGGIAYAVYIALQNRAGGSDFSGSDEDVGSLGKGATVVKLQVSLDSSWDSGNIQDTLSLLAAKNSALQSRSDIANLLSEASIALLRRQNDWNAAAFEGITFVQQNSKET